MCQVVWCALSFSPLSFHVASLISSPLTVTPPPHASLYPFKCVSLSFYQILSSCISSHFSCISPGVIGLHSTVDLRQKEDWEELTAVSVMRHGDKIQPGRLDGSLWAECSRQLALLLFTCVSTEHKAWISALQVFLFLLITDITANLELLSLGKHFHHYYCYPVFSFFENLHEVTLCLKGPMF